MRPREAHAARPERLPEWRALVGRQRRLRRRLVRWVRRVVARVRRRLRVADQHVQRVCALRGGAAPLLLLGHKVRRPAKDGVRVGGVRSPRRRGRLGRRGGGAVRRACALPRAARLPRRTRGLARLARPARKARDGRPAQEARGRRPHEPETALQ
eukprot:7051938-Prymnesium_polylepis.2